MGAAAGTMRAATAMAVGATSTLNIRPAPICVGIEFKAPLELRLLDDVEVDEGLSEQNLTHGLVFTQAPIGQRLAALMMRITTRIATSCDCALRAAREPTLPVAALAQGPARCAQQGERLLQTDPIRARCAPRARSLGRGKVCARRAPRARTRRRSPALALRVPRERTRQQAKPTSV